MSSTTPRLGLTKPVGGDGVSALRTSIGANADILDAAIGTVTSALQEGVLDAGSFEVTQASGGASTSVDVASHVGRGALVQDDSVSRAALYPVSPTVAKTTVTITTAHATLPRVDAVVVDVAGVVSIVAGTATAGATIDNARDGSHGGAAIPSNALHLADLLVPATDTTISNSQIRDRRKWARGAYRRIVRFANASASDDYTRAGNPVLALIDSTNLAPRIECSGAPMRCTFTATISASGSGSFMLAPQIDGVGIDGMGDVGEDLSSSIAAFQHTLFTGETYIFSVAWEFVPAAGSHIIAPAWATAAALTPTARARVSRPLLWTVEEIVRQDAANNSTTSG